MNRYLYKSELHADSIVVSPHQDVFSRFTGGSGAPYWAILATGLNPRRIHQTGSSIVHSQWSTQGFGGLEGIAAAEKGEVGDFPDSTSMILHALSQNGVVRAHLRPDAAIGSGKG